MKVKHSLSAVSALFLIGAILTPAVIVPAHADLVSISSITPSTGSAGTVLLGGSLQPAMVNVTGQTGQASDIVEILWDNSPLASSSSCSANLITTTGTLTCAFKTSSDKGYTVSFNVPLSTAGSHTINAENLNASVTASIAFIVNPIMQIFPSSGLAGQPVEVLVSGLAANSATTITYDGIPLAIVSPDSTGSFVSTFTIPSSSFGPHQIGAIDSSGNVATAIFKELDLTVGIPPLVGRVCLVPGDSTACPQTLPPMRADSTGHLNVSVNILGSTIFNAFGISLHWDPTIMNASSADLTNIIPQNHNVSANCLNGSGFGCGSHDGPGIATLQVVGANTTAPSSGRLFKISLVGLPGVDPHIGFETGCSTVSIGLVSAPGSVPNTETCLVVGIIRTTICTTLCTETLTSVPEGIQSQSLGVHLPTALATLGGTITGTFFGINDTFVIPYAITLPGNITSWKAQFSGSTPSGIQIKVLRPTSPNIFTVVEAGPVHDPIAVLQSRLPGYPSVLTEWTVIEYVTDTLLTVLPGDHIGLTIIADPASTAGSAYPTVNATTTRYVPRNVPVNGTIDLADIFTGNLTGSTPALQVSIQPSPPRRDTTRDGIPDFVALSPEMQALGVDPCRKTVLVQLDYMVPADHSYTHKPLQEALNNATSAFDSAPVLAASTCPYAGFPKKSSGINLIFDVVNAVPQQNALNFTHSQPQSFDTIKATYFDPNRLHYFHYGLFIHQLAPGDNTSGVGETFGSNFIVSLGNWTNNVGSVFEQAGTLMHELGHNLGLSHGGGDGINFKPNYLSVMSYEHQVVGIVTKTPTGNVTRFDYSGAALPTLNETNLDEWAKLSSANDLTRWVCPDHHTSKIDLVSNSLDWNCDGAFETGVSADINNDSLTGVLTGYNDWANLRFNFTQSTNYNIGCRVFCDLGCRIGCDIGCRIGCDFGQELTLTKAKVIEAVWSAYLATPHHSTSTSVTCSPSSASATSPTTCTATLTDTDTGTPKAPTGTVSFKSSLPGSLSPTNSCTLPLGTGAAVSCFVTYTPASGSLGPQTISAAYAGDTGHLGSSGTTTVTGLLPLSVRVFFTDASPAPLKLDQSGNPKVIVNLGGGEVKSTNPGQIMAWLSITNPGTLPIQSLTITDTLPRDWVVSPTWTPGSGAIHVYFQNTTGLTRNLEITNASIISVSTSNPEQATITVTNLGLTAIQHALLPGQTILVSVKLSYSLIGTSQSSGSYPRTYTDSAVAAAWMQPNFADGKFAGQASSLFIAYAKS